VDLSEKSRAILKGIATGHSYEQLLAKDLAWTYHDIFQAASEALETIDSSKSGQSYSMEQIRQEHARAYERWDSAQDEQLRQLFRSGKGTKENRDHAAAPAWCNS
jgi:hypothetical protein